MIVALKRRTKNHWGDNFEEAASLRSKESALKDFLNLEVFASIKQLKTMMPFDELMLALVSLERPP